MLTGVFALLFGFGIFFGSISLIFIFTPLFILFNFWELKSIEEPELVKRLGQEYIEYREMTPMFFPGLAQNIRGKSSNSYKSFEPADLFVIETKVRIMKNTTCIVLLIVVLITGIVKSGRCQLPENIHNSEVVFVYVHGFGEFKEVTPFEEKMQEFLEQLPINATIFTYRWDRLKIDVTKVVSQWHQAKIKADQAAKTFMDDIIMGLEAEKIPYFIAAYSLGTRVVAESLKHGDSRLEFLRGIYFLGSALPHTYTVNGALLPEDMKIISYYSPYLDEVLKISFYNAEGIKAGGEIGFDDTTRIQNYRTVCTHIHKGGPLQRDYSNLASAIGYISLFKERIFVKSESTKFNLEMPVSSGSLHWNDIIEFEVQSHSLLIQQNVNTYHYRAVAIDEEWRHVRKAWGTNLHSILKELNLFPSPYKRIIQVKGEEEEEK